MRIVCPRRLFDTYAIVYNKGISVNFLTLILTNDILILFFDTILERKRKKMRKKELGKTGLNVSIVGLGGAHIGLPRALVHRQYVTDPSGQYMDFNVGIATVRSAVHAGCTLLDTAPLYGNTVSESIIGMALRRQPDDLFTQCVITTKIGCRYSGDRFDHSYGAAQASFVGSIRRLGASAKFKVLYLHDPMGYEMDHVLQGTLRAMKEWKRTGLISHIGLAANDPETTADYLETGEFEVATISGCWSLINQHAAKRILPLAQKYGVGLIVTTGLERGLLATGPMENITYLERRFSPECLDHVRAIKLLCQDFDIPLGAAALQWCTRIPEIASVIPGASNPREAVENAYWGSFVIPNEFWAELEPMIWHFESYEHPMR